MIVRSENSTAQQISDLIGNPKRLQSMQNSQFQPNGFNQSPKSCSNYGTPRVSVDESWSSDESSII